MKSIFAASLLALCGSVDAATVVFDFKFYDSTGQPLGTGSATFENATGTGSSVRSFENLGAFSWEFDLQALGIHIGSSLGDEITLGAIRSQGFYVTTIGVNAPRTLQLFDRTAEGIESLDSSAPLATGVRFTSFSNTVNYVVDGNSLGTGTYTATEVIDPVPEVSHVVLLGASAAFGLLRRRRVD